MEGASQAISYIPDNALFLSTTVHATSDALRDTRRIKAGPTASRSVQFCMGRKSRSRSLSRALRQAVRVVVGQVRRKEEA